MKKRKPLAPVLINHLDDNVSPPGVRIMEEAGEWMFFFLDSIHPENSLKQDLITF